MRESKECLECGGIYFRPEYVHKRSEWEARKYCSVKCANEAAQREKRGLFAKSVEDLSTIEGGMQESPELVSELTESSGEGKLPIERQLRIVRVGPNPRMVVCEYYELAERRLCTVMVKRNAKFVRGMSFKLSEPRSEAAFVRPWIYDGPPPRRRGRW